MAITITAGAWATGSTAPAPTLPASPQAGDVHVLFVGCKPYSATINTPAGWTPITNTAGTNGTVANGTDVGSVAVAAFYRVWQSGDGNPTISITSGNTALACIHRFRPTAGSTINTPVGHRGSDTSSGTGYAATMGADIGITAGDAVVSYTFLPGNNATMGTPTLSATGVTFGTVTENPATEGSSGTGLDCEASASTALPSAGPSSAAATVGWTLSVAQTGMSDLIRIRETVNYALTPNPITLGTVALASPALTQDHALTPSALLLGTQALASPALTQDHVLTPSALTLSAIVLASPALTVFLNYALTPDLLALGAMELSTSVLTQDHVLIPSALLLGAISLSGPALLQVHALTPDSLLLGAVALASPALTQDHAMVADALLLGAMALSSPALSQVHLLTPEGLLIGGIVLATPVLAEEGGNHDLTPSPLLLGAMELGTPALTQVHILTPGGLLIGTIMLSSPALHSGGLDIYEVITLVGSLDKQVTLSGQLCKGLILTGELTKTVTLRGELRGE